MRLTLIALVSALGLLGGCATTGADGAGHAGMSHAEMMRHCEQMEDHRAHSGGAAHMKNAPRHAGMTRDEMVRHCRMMREQQAASPDAAPPETPQAAPHPH